MTGTIRLAVVADAHALATIHVEGWVAAYREILPPEVFALRTVEDREQEFASVIAEAAPGHTIWVSERDGRVVGFAYTRPGRDADIAHGGELKLFYVLPELRGSGIGLPLFEDAVADLRARGLQPYLYTFPTNTTARAWYEKRGWRHDGATAPWSEKGEYPEIVEVRYRPAPR